MMGEQHQEIVMRLWCDKRELTLVVHMARNDGNETLPCPVN